MDLKIKTSLQLTHKKVSKPPERFHASSLDKLMHYTNLYHDGQCRCVITFDGRMDLPRLNKAVELSMKVAPILSCRFAYHPWQSYWEKDAVSTNSIPFRHVETDDPEKETHKFLAAPLNSNSGIQLSVLLIRSQNDTLCIKLSHLVADARGLLDYIANLGYFYTKLISNPDYIQKEIPECTRGVGQVLRHVGIAALLKGFFNWSYPKSQWGFPQGNSNFSAISFPVRLICNERLTVIKTFCHEKGFKFTDVLTAAFYQSLIDILNPSTNALLPIQMTKDLRSYLPSGKAETICNMTGAYYPVIRYTKGTTYDQTLLDVVKAVSDSRKGKSWFGGVVFLEILSIFPGFIHNMLARHTAKRELSRGMSHPFFSNLGEIDPSLVDFGDLKTKDLGLFGPVSFPPNFLATVYSFRGQLYINSSFCPTATDPQLVDKFLDRFLNYLPA